MCSDIWYSRLGARYALLSPLPTPTSFNVSCVRCRVFCRAKACFNLLCTLLICCVALCVKLRVFCSFSGKLIRELYITGTGFFMSSLEYVLLGVGVCVFKTPGIGGSGHRVDILVYKGSVCALRYVFAINVFEIIFLFAALLRLFLVSLLNTTFLNGFGLVFSSCVTGFFVNIVVLGSITDLVSTKYLLPLLQTPGDLPTSNNFGNWLDGLEL